MGVVKSRKSRKVQGGRRHSSGAGLGRVEGIGISRRPVSPRESDGVHSKAPTPRTDATAKAQDYVKAMSNDDAAIGQEHSIECRAHRVALEATTWGGDKKGTRRISKATEAVMVNCAPCRDNYDGES